MLSVSSRLAAGCLLVGLAASLPIPSPAQEPADEAGFVSLFNGKDLTGWVYKSAAKEPLDGKTETPDGRMVVKDGVIVALAKDAKGGGGIKDLNTVKEFNGPFVLRLQFKAAEKADSGVYIRGVQQQVRDFPRRGEMKQLAKFKTDGWNDLEFVVSPGKTRRIVNGKDLAPTDRFELTVDGDKAVGKLNGKELAVASYQLKEEAEATATVNGEKLGTMTVPLKGGVGLQAETGEFAFRNVRVKELK